MSKQAKLAGLEPVENNDTFSVRVRVGVQRKIKKRLGRLKNLQYICTINKDNQKGKIKI